MKILVVEDSRAMRMILVRTLRQAGFAGHDVIEAENGAEALEQARLLKPDVVLMDLLMPVMDGIEATARIRRELPDVEVVALTSVLDDDKVVGAVRAGAIGYLLKDAEAEQLCRAVKAAAAGEVQIAPKAAARLLREVRLPESPETLTERETEVLKLLARGQSNKEIARHLTISDTTAKTYVGTILAKLGLPGRIQAALYAVHIGLVSADEATRGDG